MITGVVRDREALITLRVRGQSQHDSTIEAVIDTGYNAYLSLPPDQIASLELVWQGIGRAALGDGSECLFDVFEAEVEWDGQMARILVDEADTDPLVGMALLDGCELRIEVCGDGTVEIKALDM